MKNYFVAFLYIKILTNKHNIMDIISFNVIYDMKISLSINLSDILLSLVICIYIYILRGYIVHVHDMCIYVYLGMYEHILSP